jgi:ABC-type molybdate transport system substrate-binding protein
MMRTLAFALAILVASGNDGNAEPVTLYAAGSLRRALNDVIGAFQRASGAQVRAKYGASGLLKDEIAAGAKADVFASANMEHPRALAIIERSTPPVLFARNRLCALVRPGLEVTTANLLDRLLDPGVKVGTSTPVADPSGDYAFEMFRKAERIKPGAQAQLEKKALKLTGGPGSAPAPAGRNVYGWHVAEGRADIFLTYCTNALTAKSENPGQHIVALPEALAVGANYGPTVMNTAPPAAYRLALFILSPDGQRILANHGFGAPGLPE